MDEFIIEKENVYKITYKYKPKSQKHINVNLNTINTFKY